ncbi:MmgE/PrpD family protein [Ramlibacter albus]|uniref:MmgE/PrpD family protein n=1 Tax=Ramlibacter albus TaxID=2079448 RepID=A0A923S040_9BURK|nr:MmgE/PrpD family protein [Ramlibacter albus]MBC5762934.1 MmgE/PrpD family protein [Ramlibacter albus]
MSETDTPDRTRRLAERALAVTPASLQQKDVAQLQRLLLDYFGVTFGGADRPWVEALHVWAKPFAGTGRSRIAASDLDVAAHVAALVNGAAAHSFELDDTHDGSMSHPGSVVISSALAVAAERGAPADAFLAAVQAGYEVIARIGRAAGANRVIATGFHPTPLFGVFGAATAACKLYGLDATALCRAWGHALSLTAGSMQFSQEAVGAEVKRMHAGYGAHNGVLAAQFSMAGIEAPHSALDGRYGFLPLYGEQPDMDALTAEGPAAIHEISLKPYSCCRLLHSMIDGLREVTQDFSLPFERIASIRVTGPSKLQQQHVVRRPATAMAAQYSLPFTVGATLACGPHRFDAYETVNLSNPEVLRWADKVEVGEDAEFERLYPEHFGTHTEIRLADGEVRVARVLDSKGTPANPMPLEEVAAKARGLIHVVAPRYDMHRLRQTVADFSGTASVANLQSLLARPH